jgi:hypothetical protein
MSRLLLFCFALTAAAQDEQPLAANIERVHKALEFLGAPLSTVDSQIAFEVTINPEGRVKVARGELKPVLQQAGYTPVLIKVINQAAVTKELRMVSPQAGTVYAGMSDLSAVRMQRTHLKETATKRADAGRFLDLEMYARAPMSAELNGAMVEYVIGLIYSKDAGKREATIGFEIGAGNQDLGFRGEVPVLFEIRPAIKVPLNIEDFDGKATAASLTFRDRAGHVFPPQAKRLAPDFYFQRQVYRNDGDSVLLPPGELEMEFTRGPEYRRLKREVTIKKGSKLGVKLERWINPMEFGFYSGDHHIHGAGCAHYTSPTEGVRPEDMFMQVKGEALNVGCVLTWGPCYDYQRQFFKPIVNELSEPLTVMKYDLEISGFGSQALGHVCLLNLKDQTFPGSDGTKDKGWPTWTTPVMRWAKAQGGVTGYAHSASGMEINSVNASKRLFARYDRDKDQRLMRSEVEAALLPRDFAAVDSDRDGVLIEAELIAAHDRAAEELPNLAIPEMNGVGAMEVCVSAAMGACDFMSSMDTARIQEWTMWYHILNCGFPLKVSGETDFPCMSGERVGQGRVYLQLGKVKKVNFGDWCNALAKGRSYVSDGFAHALEFSVNGKAPGFEDVKIAGRENVKVKARVAFAPETPKTVAQGTLVPSGAVRFVGDSVTIHGPRIDDVVVGGLRVVELIVNGKVAAKKEVAADGKIHDLEFEVEVAESSWVALRQFPQLHTNPVNVLVGGKPIRASRVSAFWCVEATEQLWRNRERSIVAAERDEARATFAKAIEKYRVIASEAK